MGSPRPSTNSLPNPEYKHYDELRALLKKKPTPFQFPVFWKRAQLEVELYPDEFMQPRQFGPARLVPPLQQ